MSIKSWLVRGESFRSGSVNLGLFILRVFMGLTMALAHGLGKMPPSAEFVQGVAKLGFPAAGFFAWAAGLSEFAGGLLIALGLATRPAAFFLFTTMAVAAFRAHGTDPFSVKEMALLYAAIAICLLLVGAGNWSLDAALRRRSRP